MSLQSCTLMEAGERDINHHTANAILKACIQHQTHRRITNL